MKNPYRRLPGRRWLTLGATHSLWMGKDHLLRLAAGYSESYQRFWYGDIQAIVVQNTDRGRVWNLVLGGLTALFLLTWGMKWGFSTGAVFWIIAAALPISLLIINLLRGPTCITHLQTAVTRVELPSLGRVRDVRKAMALLGPRIEEAQGTLTGEELASLPDAPREEPAVPPRVAPPPGTSPRRTRSSGGRLHALLFSCLLLDAVLAAIDFRYQSVLVSSLSLFMFAVVTVTLVGALAGQQNSAVSGEIRSAVWCAVGYWVLGGFFLYAMLVYAGIQDPNLMQNYWECLKYYSFLPPERLPVLYVAGMAHIAVPLAIGACGLLRLRTFRQRSGVSAGIPAVPSA